MSTILRPKEIIKVVEIFKEFSIAMTPGTLPTPVQLRGWAQRIIKSESAIVGVLRDPE